MTILIVKIVLRYIFILYYISESPTLSIFLNSLSTLERFRYRIEPTKIIADTNCTGDKNLFNITASAKTEVKGYASSQKVAIEAGMFFNPL